MCLQYGRFCFSSAFRDLFAVGVPRMFVGIMIATVLFAAVGAVVSASGMSTFHAAPVSLHAVVAGIVFGVGMVFAGGCASGSLYKTGEGNGSALLVVLSLSTTIALFAQREPRFEADMPLTLRCSGSVAVGSTKPPGHMQKEYTPRGPTCALRVYSAAPRSGWPA